MSKNIFVSILLILLGFSAKAQFPNMGKGGQAMMNVGRVYGKIIDSKTGKSIDAASVQLYQNKYDSVTKTKNAMKMQAYPQPL
jgi:hypothetical protein